MGVITNINIYAILILPIAILVKGHNIMLSRHMMLFVVALCIQIAESLLISSLVYDSHSVIVQIVAFIVQNTLCPFIEIMFFAFVLNDNKASKVFKLAEYDEDGNEGDHKSPVWISIQQQHRKNDSSNNNDNSNASDTRSYATDSRISNEVADYTKATALTCVWTICYTALNRWIGWYRVINSLGFEADIFVSALAAFAQVLCVQRICLLLCSRSQADKNRQSKYNTTTNFNNSNNSNSNSSRNGGNGVSSSSNSKTEFEENRKYNHSDNFTKRQVISMNAVGSIIVLRCIASVISAVVTSQMYVMWFASSNSMSQSESTSQMNVINDVTHASRIATCKYLKEAGTFLILFILLLICIKQGVIKTQRS